MKIKTARSKQLAVLRRISWTTWVLIGILVFAACVRMIALEHIPPGFNQDEASVAYDAYSVLHTGRDRFGTFFPVLFTSYFNYRPALFTYSAVPFIALFELTEVGLRVTSVFFGLLTILTTFILVRTLFDVQTGLWTAFLLAVSPWHLSLSRVGFESILMPFYFTLGFYLLYSGIKGKRNNLWLSAIPFGLSLHTYEVMKLFVPLFLGGMGVLYARQLLQVKKQLLIWVCIFLLIAAPLVYLHVAERDKINSRLNQVSILKESEWASTFFKNVARYYSFSYLFSGKDHKLAHVLGHGKLYLFELPLLVLGTILVLRMRKPKGYCLIWWLLIFAIPASFTRSAHSLRTANVLPLFEIFCAVAIVFLVTEWQKNRRKVWGLIVVSLALFALFNIFTFARLYFVEYPADRQAWYWFKYGMKDTVTYLSSQEQNYDELVMALGNHQPYIYALFYSRYPPIRFQDLVATEGTDIVAFGPYRFCKLPDCFDSSKRTLYLAQPNQLPPNVTILKQSGLYVVAESP